MIVIIITTTTSILYWEKVGTESSTKRRINFRTSMETSARQEAPILTEYLTLLTAYFLHHYTDII